MTQGKVSIAKITRPKITGIIPRKRLFSLLDAERNSPVVWISAPAGSGKTTLTANYLDDRKLPSLWYRVDEGDADIASFFYYMGIAAKKAAPRYKKPLPLLTPEYLAGIPTFTRRWFENLFGRLSGLNCLSRLSSSSRSNRVALVLDNYQDAPLDSQFHDMITNGFDVIPEGVNVIVISRTDPPPQLSRLLANNKIARIGWEEIKFNLEETKEFVKNVGVTRRVAQDRAIHRIAPTLHKQTDGWAAGMVLMMQNVGAEIVPLVKGGQEVVPAQDGRPQGSPLPGHETIFNYFASEIFGKADKQTQDFLLKTAFSPGMTADMAEKLTGEAHAGQILSGLNKNNYFCQRHVGAGSKPAPAYCYHPLFREFLLAKAKKTYSGDVCAKMRRETALLLAEAGRIEEAAKLLQEAKDFASLAEHVLRHAPSLLAQGRNKTLDEWLACIPRHEMESDPYLLQYAGLCRLPFDFRESRNLLQKSFHLLNARKEYPAALFVAA